MRKFVFQLSICLTIFLTFQTIAHAAGVLDRSFGTNGTVTTVVSPFAQAKKVKIQPDGKIIVLGTIGSVPLDTVLIRYNKDGSLDTGFGENGIVVRSFSTAEDVNDLALQSDGKIIVAGTFYSSATQSNDFLVARFNQNGTLDTSFGTNGIATVNQSSVDIFYSVAIQADNKIVAVGATSQNNYDFAAIRFNANGSLDSTFSNGGLFFYDLGPFTSGQSFRAVAVLPNGRIIIGGDAYDSITDDVLVMLEPNGAFVSGFGNNGIRRETVLSGGFTYDFAVLPDGRFLALSNHIFQRFLSSGAPDPTFRRMLTPFDNIDNAGSNLAVRSDGKIIVLNQGGYLQADMVVYTENGRDISRARNIGGRDVAVQSDDKIVVVDAANDSLVLKRYIAISSPGTRIADPDYDQKTDLIVLSNGLTVNILNSSQSPTTYQLSRVPGDVVRIMPEDYSNSPFSLTYWRLPMPQSGSAYFENINTSNNIQSSFQWGAAGDIPVGGDYDGETLRQSIPYFRKPSELAIFRPSTGDWWIYNRRTNAYFTVHWGAAGDKPVPADYDYDGITDYAIYRPSTGTWWIHRSSDDSYFTLQFGTASDIPLTGDYDGDGRADFTVYRPSEGNWYQYLTSEGFRVVHFGVSTDIPVPGDYDGDGRHDVAVFRQGVWYILQSTEGLKIVQWGNQTDSPVAVRYDQ